MNRIVFTKEFLEDPTECAKTLIEAGYSVVDSGQEKTISISFSHLDEIINIEGIVRRFTN